MKLETNGILIGLRVLGEKNLIGTFFTKDYGIISGILKAGQISKNKYQAGMYGNITWNARLEEHLGIIHFETQKNLSAKIMIKPLNLQCLNSMFALLLNSLPEKQKQYLFYDETLSCILKLETSNCLYEYSLWELKLLKSLGYGLDLTKCGNCKSTENLMYLSPKTGRSICRICGNEYKDKLFKLPENLKNNSNSATNIEIYEIVCIATHFFEKISFLNDSFKVPYARNMLIETIKSLL